MKSIKRYLSNFWTRPTCERQAVILAALIFCSVITFLLLTSSCSTSPAGLATEQKIVNTATNIVAKLTAAAPAIPPPYSTLATDILYVISAGLAFWNTWQHKQISALQSSASTTAAAATPAVPANGTGPAG
jgi:hypothetical protein